MCASVPSTRPGGCEGMLQRSLALSALALRAPCKPTLTHTWKIFQNCLINIVNGVSGDMRAGGVLFVLFTYVTFM